jgi:hypothetical protein
MRIKKALSAIDDSNAEEEDETVRERHEIQCWNMRLYQWKH